MKHQLIVTNTLAVLLGLSAFGSDKIVAPSQNSALNSISKSNASKKKAGMMQRSLDSWLKDDWEPTIAKDKEIQKKYLQKKERDKTHKEDSPNKEAEKSQFVDKEDKPFKLQEFVDKAEAYMRAKPNDYEKSNVHKLESMPVIGK